MPPPDNDLPYVGNAAPDDVITIIIERQVIQAPRNSFNNVGVGKGSRYGFAARGRTLAPGVHS